MSAAVLGVIPARIGSTRLPRKPLHLIAGRPLIEWVWRRARSTQLFERLVIATDSDEVARVAAGFGAEARLTAPEHPSGTDRVAEVVQDPEFGSFRFVINLQGDEPLIERSHLAAARGLVVDEGWEVGTLVTRFPSRADWESPDQVKAVRGDDGGALFFSRAPVPFSRDAPPSDTTVGADGMHLRHLGVYAYRREALLRWVSLPESTLERTERLEQLRPLAAGIRIGLAEVDAAPPGVDTPEDARRVERLLEQEQSFPQQRPAPPT